MLWLDLAGAPGSGKSTLADALWGPHAIPIEDRLPPESWHDWVNEISRLFHLIREHPTLPAALRMVNRSVRKIATVARAGTLSKDQESAAVEHQTWYGPYIQTGLVQRGLGFGWRMVDLGLDLNELRHYFRLMPVSIGVAVTRCPQEIVVQRNRDREKVAATAFENRQHMVPLMQPAIELAIEVLRGRHVPLVEIDTTQPVEAAREQLLAFADANAGHVQALGYSSEMAPILSAPVWWQGPGSRSPVPLAHPRAFRPSPAGWRPY